MDSVTEKGPVWIKSGGVADLKVGPRDVAIMFFCFFESAIYKILTAFSVRNSISDLCFYYS
jgi:hypothetical protein